MTALPELPAVRPVNPAARLARARRRWPLTVAETIALAVLVVVVLAAVAPGLLAPANPLAVHPADAFQPPSLAHPFGTDDSGRDQ
jgi:peptide/nickel transport system permease protein